MKIAGQARIVPGEATVIACSPPGENRWGFYQFPDLWRAPGGEIYLNMNVSHDCLIGEEEPNQFFVSRDDGKSWRNAALEEMDLSPQVVEFSDGSQAAFGRTHFIYHYHGYMKGDAHWQWLHPAKLDMRPLSGPLMDAYQNQAHVLYRYGDVPEEHRTFPMRCRRSPDAPWEQVEARIHAPEMLVNCVGRAWWWDKDQKAYEKDIEQCFFRPWPRWTYGLARLNNDTLLWAHFCPHPASVRLSRFYCSVMLLVSSDRGRNWHPRAMIADDTDLTTDGYSGDEHALQVMPNGDLFCVMRTELGDRPKCTRYLAATRSRDGGFTWTKPEALAPFSVTPLMMVLRNGMAALAYGRPGVYVRASSDSALHWSKAITVVGPPEAEVAQQDWWKVRYGASSDDKISCGNLGAVVTGTDRFLLAYSDFRHVNERGERCKAVLVQEFTVSPCRVNSVRP
ncbi:MAG: exo-alpha-sialidase [Planctomycetes bacterium]|nr:exo-alpha-sialidase [Planctomycetota bacterium]